jgi:hypothetical protein
MAADISPAPAARLTIGDLTRCEGCRRRKREPGAAWCPDCTLIVAIRKDRGLAADLESLDMEGGALLLGKLDLTYQTRAEGGVTSTPWPMSLLLFVPKARIKPTAAFDLRLLLKPFKETNPSTWKPIP